MSVDFFRRLAGALLVCTMLLRAVFAANKKPELRVVAAPATLTPTPKDRPLMTALAGFGKRLRIAQAATGESDIIIELEPILTKTGKSDMPPDVTQQVREVIAKIGRPLRTYEALTAVQLIKPFLPVSPADRPAHPTPMYRLSGALERAYEREVFGHELEFYLRVGGGHTSGDAQKKNSKRTTITRVTLSLTLEQPDGLDLATATYFVDVLKTEGDGSWGFFVGGSGVGGGKNLIVADDLDDSIFDLAAASVMNVIGSGAASLIPYDRCSPAFFPEDSVLEERERQSLNRMLPAELAQMLKPLLYVEGVDMEMRTAAVTPRDREQMAMVMRSRGLDFSDRAALVRFALDRWKNVPIGSGADRLEARIEEVVRNMKQRQADQAAAEAAQKEREAAGIIDPSRFGWSNSAPVILLDLTAVTDTALRAGIITTALTCDGCEEVRKDAATGIFAVRLRPAALPVPPERQIAANQILMEQALRHARFNAEFLWVGEQQKKLRIVPIQDKARARKRTAAPTLNPPLRMPDLSARTGIGKHQ